MPAESADEAANVAVPIAGGNPATDAMAIIALLGFLIVSVKLIMAIGKLVDVLERVRFMCEKHDGMLIEHSKQLAVINTMLSLDDLSQALTGPRIRSRRPRE